MRLSSGISANILDFGLPQKHVLRTCRRGARPQGRLGITNSAAAQARQQRQSRREPMGVSFDTSKSGQQGRRDRPVPEIAPVPTAGSKGMSLKFEIQPAQKKTRPKGKRGGRGGPRAGGGW